MMEGISKKILQMRLRNSNALAQKQFLGWQQITSVGLILSSDEGINRNLLDKWISDTKKYIEVFYVETKSKTASFGDWQCFTKKETNLFGLPTKLVEKELAGKKFDLVINAANAQDVYAAALLQVLKAPYKCASSAELQDANLIVQPSVQGNLIHQLQDTLRYLQMIKTN